VVQRLIADERVDLAGFPRADAYVALYPFLSKVVVPRGVGDLAKDLPPKDVILFAPKASLVVHEDLHPAIQYLLLTTALHIHSGPSIFQNASAFPGAEAGDFPLSSEAVQFYKSGRPFLNYYLPFWVAALVGKLIVLLIPILAVLYPMMRLLPRLYDWMMRSKVSRLYGELRFLEDEMMAARGRRRYQRDGGAARSAGGAGQPAAGSGRLCKHAVHAAQSHRSRARAPEERAGGVSYLGGQGPA
jgi:hypothetical protein